MLSQCWADYVLADCNRWLFNGLGPVLNPSICVLLDVGTRPGNDSIYHLWKAMDNDSRVAGCAGEIRILKGDYKM